MKQLNNNIEDINFLNSLIQNGIKPKAKIKMGVFTNPSTVLSFKQIEFFGRIVYIDLIDGYCHWTSNGQRMPCVNISCISLFENYER